MSIVRFTMTTIIHFYGAPCSGKTVAASRLFHDLKIQHINVELVTEYAKQWAWESRKITKFDQIYIVANQIHRETVLLDKVDMIVTDSPFPLGSFYEEYYTNLKMTRAMIRNIRDEMMADGHQFISYFLEYSGYNLPEGVGRYHNHQSSLEINQRLRHWLEEMEISCRPYTPDISPEDLVVFPQFMLN